jgi:hypothetical protein
MTRKLGSVVLGLFLWSLAVACGSSDEPEPEEVPTPPDEQIAGRITEMLAAGASDALIASFQQDVARLQLELDDPAAADEVIRASLLASIRDGEQLSSLDGLSTQLGGRVFSTRFVTPAGMARSAPIGGRAAVPCPTDEPENIIYYVNGIGTPIFQALGDLQSLARRASPALVDGADVEFRLFYNPSGWGTDVGLCSAAGLLLSGTSLSEADRARWQGIAQQRCDNGRPFQDFLYEALAQWAFQSSDSLISEQLTLRLREVVMNDISGGKRVTLVAHSQGNFYARDLVRLLPGDAGASLGVVSVASPVSFEPALLAKIGAFSLTQAEYDIIGMVPGSPESNVASPLSAAAMRETAQAVLRLIQLGRAIFTGASRLEVVVRLFRLLYDSGQAVAAGLRVHAFASGYLGFESTATSVASGVRSSLDLLRNDRPVTGQGYLQVSLTWNVPGDIDLYVTEPAGNRVYFGRRMGVVGELDRDDIAGTGPENYFVCLPEVLVEGTYAVSVNNYGGTTGTQAEINVRAGSQFRRYPTTMDAPNGGARLIPVATIEYRGREFLLSP